jgi:hypothetical protein
MNTDQRALLRGRQPQTERVVEFFLGREAAEAMIDGVREDEPLLAEEPRVEAIELGILEGCGSPKRFRSVGSR